MAKEYGKTYRDNKRRKAMNIISNGEIKCVNCGCTNFSILEINHKNGGGRAERRNNDYKNCMYFYNSIINGDRSKDDLEVLCKVCNVLHYIKLQDNTIDYKIVCITG